ncbi:hypothetical protein L195_g053320 [Trifolium pratense]|uniref:Secreted protein n=2 Tax=Trifolium pratense TaxID=57577 RepID=A0A2K3K9X2_TRIPR|nr:hypothetical protein L195_g053320 [Trifolium pratense]CAJ2635846.1 unnamed protein product [Trifolium pratense]
MLFISFFVIGGIDVAVMFVGGDCGVCSATALCEVGEKDECVGDEEMRIVVDVFHGIERMGERERRFVFLFLFLVLDERNSQ